ncbi:MAG: hypothetical protein RLZZ157_1236, partial [Pseudomonadota bacterium]
MNAHGSIIELPEKGRRCALTILFSDLCDSTLIASRIDPEIYADFLVAQRDIFDTIVARHRGIVARVDGDGALCLFGYPDMRDHGTKPALEAALELHAAIAQLESQFDFSGTPVRLHSAINTGVVLLKNGDMVRGRYEVLGDVTNIAAKLCDFAAPNQIIISETALGADRQHFELGASQKVLLAGRARKTSIVSVVGKKARGNATHHMVHNDGLGRFVGRQAQLDELKGWLSHTGASGSNVAILFGPAGIGKTRLLGELLKSAQAADVRFVIGACDDQIGTHPLQPFFQILAQIHPGAPSQQAGLPDTSQIQAFAQAFCADLAHFSAQGRSLIVIEDWHWASDLARLMLNIILGELPPNVRVLLSSRNNIPDIIGGRLVTHVEVPPWTPRETSTAAAHMLGLPDVVASQWLEASSGGNPLFLQELCYGVRRGEIRDNGDTKSAWLEALIQSRFSQLPQDQAEILQAAAVLGQVSPAWLFEAVAGVGYDDDRVCALIAADFLSHSDLSDTIRFKHGITKDAVYALIGPNARRDWHGRAADALLARSRALGEAAYLDGLAYHCFAAGRTEQALDYSMKVGEIALHTGSLDRAQVHFSNAFKLTAKLQDRERANALYWSIINKFGLSCIVDPAPSHLEWMGLMVKEIERVGTQRQKARGAYWLGTLHYGLGNGWESVAHLRAARIMAAEARDERLVTQIDVKLAQSLFATGQYN